MPQKLDQSATASRKALALFGMLLFSQKPYSLKQLAEYLNCSRQTILRVLEDIEWTNTFTITKWKEGKENWYQAYFPEKRPNIAFSKEEFTQLCLYRDFMEYALPAKHRMLLFSAIEKIACFLEHDAAEKQLLSESHGKGLGKGSVDYSAFEETLGTLVAACKTRQVVEIEYLALLRADSRIHAFVPVRIVSYRDGLYLRGWRVTDKGAVDVLSPMTLAVHRIQRIWPTCRNLSSEKAKSHAFLPESSCFGMAAQTAPFTVQTQFFPPAATYVGERIWSQEQLIVPQSDGSILLTFTAQSEMEVVKWILGFGQEAKLITPEHLRAQLIEELRVAMSRYSQKQEI